MSRRFQRTIENFSCAQCGREVTGTGYTNHCPACLWSKHVDVHPGDRAEECKGAMEPISAFQKHGEWRIVHRCTQCGAERVCTTSPDDDIAQIAPLAGRPRR